MDLEQCIETRTSIREYKKNRKIAENLIEDILNAAIRAPSAGNTQDWEFIVVRKRETKDALAKAALDQEFLKEADVIIAVCSNLERITERYGERGRSLYSVQDTAAAVQNILLAAWNKGIGSCWVGAFNEQMVKDALILPTDIRPLALIALGYPAIEPLKMGRRKASEVVHQERY